MPSDNPLSYNKRGARSSALLKYDKSNSMLGSQSRENFSSRLRLPSNRTDNFIKYEPDKNQSMKQRVDHYMKLMNNEDDSVILDNDSR